MHRLARMMLIKAPEIADYIRGFERSEREHRWFALGLAIAHFEEALARGERQRAEAHAHTAADLIDSLKADAPPAPATTAPAAPTTTVQGWCSRCGRMH